MSAVVIIDYGMGNLKSVFNAFSFLGANARVSSNPKDIESAEKVILPGVGAFGDAMAELHSRNLVHAIQCVVKKERPFLGICLGLQLLFEKSEEADGIEGLGIIPGKVERIIPREIKHGLKIPHMGWNTMQIMTNDCPILRNVPDNSYFYFVHSFCAQSETPALLGKTVYGRDFASMVWHKNVFGAQFHPEKSQEVGLQILKNFMEL